MKHICFETLIKIKNFEQNDHYVFYRIVSTCKLKVAEYIFHLSCLLIYIIYFMSKIFLFLCLTIILFNFKLYHTQIIY